MQYLTIKINFDNFDILAADCNNIRLLLTENLLIKGGKPNVPQCNKIISVRRGQFYLYFYMIVRVFLINSSDFNVCTGRARICLSMSS